MEDWLAKEGVKVLRTKLSISREDFGTRSENPDSLKRQRCVDAESGR